MTFTKNDFHLELAAGSCTGPAGQVTHAIVPAGRRTDRPHRSGLSIAGLPI